MVKSVAPLLEKNPSSKLAHCTVTVSTTTASEATGKAKNNT